MMLGVGGVGVVLGVCFAGVLCVLGAMALAVLALVLLLRKRWKPACVTGCASLLLAIACVVSVAAGVVDAGGRVSKRLGIRWPQPDSPPTSPVWGAWDNARREADGICPVTPGMVWKGISSPPWGDAEHDVYEEWWEETYPSGHSHAKTVLYWKDRQGRLELLCEEDVFRGRAYRYVDPDIPEKDWPMYPKAVRVSYYYSTAVNSISGLLGRHWSLDGTDFSPRRDPDAEWDSSRSFECSWDYALEVLASDDFDVPEDVLALYQSVKTHDRRGKKGEDSRPDR